MMSGTKVQQTGKATGLGERFARRFCFGRDRAESRFAHVRQLFSIAAGPRRCARHWHAGGRRESGQATMATTSRAWVSVASRGEGLACCASRRAGSASSSSSVGASSLDGWRGAERARRRSALARRQSWREASQPRPRSRPRNVSARVSQANDEQLENILNTIRGAEALNTDPDFYTLLGVRLTFLRPSPTPPAPQSPLVCHPLTKLALALSRSLVHLLSTQLLSVSCSLKRARRRMSSSRRTATRRASATRMWRARTGTTRAST